MVMAGYHTRSHARPWLPQTHRKHQWRSPLPRLWAQGCRAEPRHARLRSLRRSCPQSVHQIRCSAAPAIERTGKPPQTDGTLAHLHRHGRCSRGNSSSNRILKRMVVVVAPFKRPSKVGITAVPPPSPPRILRPPAPGPWGGWSPGVL